MSQPLIPSSSTRHANNLNFIRLILAVAVMASHCVPLATGSNAREWLFVASGGQQTVGELAVCGFFALSGFLILQSWHITPSLVAFFQKRVLRIYPAFVVATAFSVLIVGSLGAPESTFYLERIAVGWKWWLWQTLTLDMPRTPPTLVAIPFSGAVNGSMWTIRYEWWCYVAVAAFGLLRFDLWRRRGLALTMWVAAFGLYALEVQRGGHLFGGRVAGLLGDLDEWPRFATYFLGGCAVYAYRATLRARRDLVIVSGMGIFISTFFGGLYLVLPVCGVYLLFYAAFVLPPIETMLTAGGRDFSYGTYLYAFPIQQTLMQWWGRTLTPPTLLLGSFVAVPLFAAMSWHFVERPALRYKPAKTVRPVRAVGA